VNGVTESACECVTENPCTQSNQTATRVSHCP
jgi:hypothetical protein